MSGYPRDVVAALRGNLLAFALFAAFFALHIVGGATDQGWLFAIAVVLIALTAAGFPALALMVSGAAGPQSRALTLAFGAVAGFALTAATLWAANDRAWAWWHFPAAAAISLAVSLAVMQRGAPLLRRRRGSPSPG
jgi:hypothetical protein